ncbi:uncharacterized protein LOC126797406 [Argentina anserina]|uniref:uncharacterized protein LOC126797406 n=1 Tax=Argentina anserina TaxID=57926 RepID=UPI0021767C0E|nr:uncharacterized protein LOC126797406 [Potentilla anserina]
MAARVYNNLLALSQLFAVCLFASIANAVHDWHTQNWLNHGGDLHNRRYAKYETKISPETASKLRFKWEFNAGLDITVTPSVYNGTLYFPSWNGHLYAVKASDGSLVWEKNLGTLTGLNGTGLLIGINWTLSRSTPTISGDNDELLIVGIYGPAVLIALERSTGKLVWSVRLDSHVAGAITMSPTYNEGSIYIGTTSAEEGFSPDECCTFRGSFARLDVKTGAVLWKTYMLQDNHGKRGEYSGAAIWGSSPSIHVHRRHVYIATGNTYSVPENISQCQENQLNNNSTVPTHPDACIEPGNHGNSILALDMDTGEIQWYRQLGGYDVWFVACMLNTSVCPIGPNVDADFGEAPMMLRPYINGTNRDVVVSVQKSGFAWALDRNNGSLVWSTVS